MSYKPPFTITSEILNLVADISQQVGRLDVSALNASPQLRKQNRIKTLAGTLAIEGNTLTEEQITAFMTNPDSVAVASFVSVFTAGKRNQRPSAAVLPGTGRR